MTNAICPSCGKKQFNPSTRRCYACKVEQRPDGSMLTAPPGYHVDPRGNLRSPVTGEVRDGKLRFLPLSAGGRQDHSARRIPEARPTAVMRPSRARILQLRRGFLEVSIHGSRSRRGGVHSSKVECLNSPTRRRRNTTWKVLPRSPERGSARDFADVICRVQT